MKFANIVALCIAAQGASAHYIFTTLVAGSQTSTQAVRRPQNNSPVPFGSLDSPNMRCNVDPSAARETVSVAAGSTIGFALDKAIFHEGPAAIYLGKAPGAAANWDGSGANWFKIGEQGATYNPFTFTSLGKTQVTATIPSSIPAGEYLVRAEQIGLHVTGSPEWYVSCAQIKITGGGNANPAKVSIPGYISASDPSIMANIYPPTTPTSYKVPGPAVFRG